MNLDWRLVKPKKAQQLGGLFRMLEPWRLPNDRGHQIAFRPETFSDSAGGLFGTVGVWRFDRDDQFAGVGEMLLIEFQALDDFQFGREKVEHFHIEFQSRDTKGNRHQ